MSLTWRTASVELTEGYTLLDANGQPISILDTARIAIEGGFVHIEVPDAAIVQVVSAPAVRLLAYAT